MIISDLSFLDAVSEDPGIVGGSFFSYNDNFSYNYQSNRSKIKQDADAGFYGYAANSASVDQSNSISGSVG